MAQEELNAADTEKIAGIAILSFISLVTIIFYFFVKNALSVIRLASAGLVAVSTFHIVTAIRVFAKEVVEKVKELDEEKKKTEKAFHDFLPPSVVRDIKNKKVCKYCDRCSIGEKIRWIELFCLING